MAGVMTLRNRFVGMYNSQTKGFKVELPDNPIKVETNDRMVHYQTCRKMMIAKGHGVLEDYLDGDKVLTMNDIDMSFIVANENDFYWNFFDGLYIDEYLCRYVEEQISLDKLQFNERNIGCLAYVYPKLTSRARLYGGVALASVLRNYELKYYLDPEKLACQLVGATKDFITEFGITEEMTRPAIVSDAIDAYEAIKVATIHNLKDISTFLRDRFSKQEYLHVKECSSDGIVSNETSEMIHVVDVKEGIEIYCDGELKTSIVPGDCINIETRKNTYVIKSATDGSLAHFLKFSR